MELSPELRLWVGRISWGVTTVEDCLGHEPGSGPPGWALYDEGEDDPPIAVFDFEDDAKRVCEVLRAVAAVPVHLTPERARELVKRYKPILERLDAYDRDEPPVEDAGGWDW